MMSGHTWGTASGVGRKDCYILGYRFPEGSVFDPARGESYVVRKQQGAVRPVQMKAGFYTDLWPSPTGRVYVTDAAGAILMNGGAGPCMTHEVQGTLTGIWGLDDEHVYAWGRRGSADILLRYDGASWTEMPAPQGGSSRCTG